MKHPQQALSGLKIYYFNLSVANSDVSQSHIIMFETVSVARNYGINSLCASRSSSVLYHSRSFSKLTFARRDAFDSGFQREPCAVTT
jgi:hypothetical protein